MFLENLIQNIRVAIAASLEGCVRIATGDAATGRVPGRSHRGADVTVP